MNLNQYIANKCLETASIELIKQTIIEDKNISDVTKRDWIAMINMFSTAKNITEICKILSGGM